MFAWWGRTVHRFRYAVIGITVALCSVGGIYGISLGQHVTQSGFYDEDSDSVAASLVADGAYGRDRSSHVVAILTARQGEKVTDTAWIERVAGELDQFAADHEDKVVGWAGWLRAPDSADPTVRQMKTADDSKTFVSIPLVGEDDDSILKNYQAVESDLQKVNEGNIQLAGLNPIASELTGTIGEDQKRAEVAAIPVVCVVLFFVFGGVVAAALPGIVGVLTILGALGVMRLLAEFMPVHYFAQPVVTLMGLGIAVDYGLFMVSRFREELAEGYATESAVRRAVMTAGRTIVFSAVILIASSLPLLLFPQDFLKSITYAIIGSVALAALLSVTVLPAALGILESRVDALGVGWLLKFALPDPIASDPNNPRTNSFAFASLSTGLLLPPAAIALGHLARTRIRRTGEQGARAALIGLVLGYCTLMVELAWGATALRNEGIIGGAVYGLLLGVIAFVAVVISGVSLARHVKFARGPIIWWLTWLADKTQKTKTRQEVERGFWGRLVGTVMKRPAAFATPIIVAMIVLVLPSGKLALGGISEKYLPPDNSIRVAQEDFDRSFSGFRTEPLTIVIRNDRGEPVTDEQVADIRMEAMSISGFIAPDGDTSKMWQPRGGNPNDPSVRVIQNGLIDRNDAAEKVEALRAMPTPRGITVLVGGTPALEQDSIASLFDKLPLMAVLLIMTTTILMFLAFGSAVLPIKAALMSTLTLGSTMGILTWMFVEGHGSGLMNYTPQPLMAPMIGLIIAVIWGLSTDYEVFLVSRMVEARERGMSTTEAIRIGTATTGRLITGAALVLAAVAAAFVFSDLVVMKYLAFGLLIALLLDATVIRMFLVPAVMKLLGDECWWAPKWAKRIQTKLGLGEADLPDERVSERQDGRGGGALPGSARDNPAGRRGFAENVPHSRATSHRRGSPSPPAELSIVGHRRLLPSGRGYDRHFDAAEPKTIPIQAGRNGTTRAGSGPMAATEQTGSAPNRPSRSREPGAHRVGTANARDLLRREGEWPELP